MELPAVVPVSMKVPVVYAMMVVCANLLFVMMEVPVTLLIVLMEVDVMMEHLVAMDWAALADSVSVLLQVQNVQVILLMVLLAVMD